jgi:NAD(P)-dependent dehydrogenase (short-subunit alcohol dehydrogenase family)
VTANRGRARVAIVTGATEGIGLAVSRRLAAEGAQIVLVARRREPGTRLVEELGEDRACFVAGDTGEAATSAAAVRVAHQRFGGLDVLVNNAGLDLSGVPLLETTSEDARRIFDVNFFGALQVLQAAAAAMRARGGGSIVNVTARTALVGLPGSAVYGASKGALESLTRAAALELAPYDIRVNAVAPGLTETPMVTTWIHAQPDPEAFRARVVVDIPQGRMASPEDVAAAICYLASDAAASITGASLSVDGGYTAR